MLAAGLRCPLLAVRGRACGSCECLLGWGSGGGALPGVTGGARLPDGLWGGGWTVPVAGGACSAASRSAGLKRALHFCHDN